MSNSTVQTKLSTEAAKILLLLLIKITISSDNFQLKVVTAITFPNSKCLTLSVPQTLHVILIHYPEQSTE